MGRTRRRPRPGSHRPLHLGEAARAHLDAGARKVLVSAPSDGADVTLAFGVNTDASDPAMHTIVSNASCTTNASRRWPKVLDELAGIEHGFATTMHAYTQEQNLQDGPHRDARRARAAGINIVPTTTGAAKAIGLVLPNLDGKLSGDSIRVPVPVGSIVELNTTVARDVTRDDVLAAYRAAAQGPLAGILEYSRTRSSPPISPAIPPRPSSTRPSPASTAATSRWSPSATTSGASQPGDRHARTPRRPLSVAAACASAAAGAP